MLSSFQYDESERRREMAKNSLERYTHYYERWATNQSVCTRLSLDLHLYAAIRWPLFPYAYVEVFNLVSVDASTNVI